MALADKWWPGSKWRVCVVCRFGLHVRSQQSIRARSRFRADVFEETSLLLSRTASGVRRPTTSAAPPRRRVLDRDENIEKGVLAFRSIRWMRIQVKGVVRARSTRSTRADTTFNQLVDISSFNCAMSSQSDTKLNKLLQLSSCRLYSYTFYLSVVEFSLGVSFYCRFIWMVTRTLISE